MRSCSAAGNVTALVAGQLLLMPIFTGWRLPEEKLLEVYARQHNLVTGRMLAERYIELVICETCDSKINHTKI